MAMLSREQVDDTMREYGINRPITDLDWLLYCACTHLTRTAHLQQWGLDLLEECDELRHAGESDSVNGIDRWVIRDFLGGDCYIDESNQVLDPDTVGIAGLMFVEGPMVFNADEYGDLEQM